ncbi:TDT family transporter [Actibacterium pelagium]|uniref:Tellurium resistance protein n=1 Tax=Actibacterium pelagium TaxID=2029103 RepID=A0A917ADB8_9RHOB|nr:tellurium resistance protein [Actibacterium pelagium]GGE41902.1 tellurium resistance protein [Actibacterium pelagium]
MQAIPQKPRFGDQVPPAIFPPLLGLMGLALALSRGVPVFGIPRPIVDLITGAVTLLLLFAIFAYSLKLIRRFGTLAEDIRTLPGRAGTAAMVVSIYCLAAALLPFSTSVAQVVLFAGLAWHVVLVLFKTRYLLSLPSEQRQITPVWHLSYVGFIVAILAAQPLGYSQLSVVIFCVTVPVAMTIWGLSLRDILTNETPPPLRPTLAIHLAPASLFTVTAGLLGWTLLSFAFGIVAIAIFGTLLVKTRWLTVAGFSPFWGAFTFPLAAFSSAMMSLASLSPVFGILGALSLAGALGVNPLIATRVLKLWASNQLALKTNAARV